MDNMPRSMIIRRRGKSGQGDIVEMILSRTGYSVIKTRDEDFDARFDVIGANNEVLGWLTDHRPDILKAPLATENCAVADGSLKTAMLLLKNNPWATYLLVVAQENPRKLVGTVSHNDLLAAQRHMPV